MGWFKFHCILYHVCYNLISKTQFLFCSKVPLFSDTVTIVDTTVVSTLRMTVFLLLSKMVSIKNWSWKFLEDKWYFSLSQHLNCWWCTRRNSIQKSFATIVYLHILETFLPTSHDPNESQIETWENQLEQSLSRKGEKLKNPFLKYQRSKVTIFSFTFILSLWIHFTYHLKEHRKGSKIAPGWNLCDDNIPWSTTNLTEIVLWHLCDHKSKNTWRVNLKIGCSSVNPSPKEFLRGHIFCVLI